MGLLDMPPPSPGYYVVREPDGYHYRPIPVDAGHEFFADLVSLYGEFLMSRPIVGVGG